MTATPSEGLTTRAPLRRHHPFSTDQVMAEALGVCWHSPTASHWPCEPAPEPKKLGPSILCPVGHRHLLPLFDATCWRDAEDRRDVQVTKREYDVATELLRRGGTNQQIAQKLFVSEDTVKTHMKRLLLRTGSASRTELIVAVFRDRVRLVPSSVVRSAFCASAPEED